MIKNALKNLEFDYSCCLYAVVSLTHAMRRHCKTPSTGSYASVSTVQHIRPRIYIKLSFHVPSFFETFDRFL